MFFWMDGQESAFSADAGKGLSEAGKHDLRGSRCGMMQFETISEG
jgi:hypothetical protein